jgi:hypothetical protein
LDSSASHITSISNTLLSESGLIYYWTCPLPFTAICSTQINSTILIIPYSSFLSSQANYSLNYTFTVSVWRNTDIDSSLNYSLSVNITWIDVLAPQYGLSVNSGLNKIIASKNNEFDINLYNYASTNLNLIYTWSFLPNITDYNDNVLLSTDNATMLIYAGGFNFSTSYLLTFTL